MTERRIVRMKGHQLNVTSLQVPCIKARTTTKERRVSLGKGYRPVNAASCVLGRKVMYQCRLRTTLIPPGSQTDVWVAVSWESFSAITEKWNWARKQTRSLPISPPSPDQHCLDDGFLCCSVCLLVWSGAHGYPAWRREEKRRNEGCEGEVVVAGSEGGEGGKDAWHTDLPLRWRETCWEATRQSCSTNIHRPQDQGNKERSLSLILQQMLFLTHIWWHRIDSCKFYMDLWFMHYSSF